METIGPKTNTVTITVDLNAVKALCEEIAKDNSGLETSGGLTPTDLDEALEVLVQGPATGELVDLLRKIVSIHHEMHDKHR
jgi:hypothetical protein